MFSWTLLTTIGYGTQAPVTAAGKFTVIVFSAGAIPLAGASLTGLARMWRAPPRALRHALRRGGGAGSGAETEKELKGGG